MCLLQWKPYIDQLRGEETFGISLGASSLREAAQKWQESQSICLFVQSKRGQLVLGKEASRGKSRLFEWCNEGGSSFDQLENANKERETVEIPVGKQMSPNEELGKQCSLVG